MWHVSLCVRFYTMSLLCILSICACILVCWNKCAFAQICPVSGQWRAWGSSSAAERSATRWACLVESRFFLWGWMTFRWSTLIPNCCNVVAFFLSWSCCTVFAVQNLISTLACPRIRDPRLTRGDKTLGQMRAVTNSRFSGIIIQTADIGEHSTVYRTYDDVWLCV